MQSMFILCLLAAGSAVEGARSREDNPLAAVISLLNGLEAKVTAEGEVEAKAYHEFTQWCDTASQNAGFDIQTATSQKEKLEATISKASSDIGVATSQIETLAGDIASADGEHKNAATIRAKELADFVANEAELVDVVDTLGRAISTLEREMTKNPAAFAQLKSVAGGNLVKSLEAIVDAVGLETADKTKLVAMVQNQQSEAADDDDAGAPAAAVYQSHSGNIVDVLEDLKEKAEEQLSALRKAESNSKHNFNMLAQSLTDQIAADEKDKAGAEAARNSADETKASSEGSLAVTEKDLANAKKTKETVGSSCMTMAADHAASVAGREAELKALADAKKILSDTSSGAVEQTYSFLQYSSRTGSQLQTRADLAHFEVISLVKRLAAEQHSSALAQLASRITAVVKYGSTAGDDVFGKVKALISDLIAKLESESSADATEKSYCDEQMAKTESKRDELNSDVSKLTAKIDQAVAQSAQLKDEVKTLQASLAALAKQQAGEDTYRQDAHAAYVTSKADLELGLSGVNKALGLLRDYYGSAAALVQQPAVPMHSAATGAGGGIIGILEVVESDFAKNLATEETQEADSASAYEKVTQENKIVRAQKEQDVKYKTQNFKSLDKSIAELSSDRSSADTELAAVLEYYAKIKERCIAKPETYEARKGRRTAEIAGLKEALAILEEETAFVQRKKHGHHGFLRM